MPHHIVFNRADNAYTLNANPLFAIEPLRRVGMNGKAGNAVAAAVNAVDGHALGLQTA